MTQLDVVTRAFSVTITATTDIAAPPARVWAVLTDTASYPQWNPLLRRLEGPLEPGSRLTVDFQPQQQGPVRTMRPRVEDVQPGRAFTWLGSLGVRGLLDGRHAFRVEPTATGTRFVQHEVLSGALTPLLRRLLTRDTPRAFVALNDALAERARA